MDTVLKVCKQETTPTPKKIIYHSVIEKSIESLEKYLKDTYKLPNYLLRWISLKVIDGEEKILESIEKNFSISLINNIEVQSIRSEILNTLKETKMSGESFKDTVVSLIIKRSETICKKVCTFETENHSR